MRSVFAERLREKQKQLNLTQVKMAELLNVAPGTLGSYLREEKVPTIEKALDIAKRLDVTVGWLCGEDAPEKGSNIKNYADLITMIEDMRKLPFFEGILSIAPSKVEIYTPNGVVLGDGISVEIADPILSKFYKDYEAIKGVVASEAFGTELLDAWLYKKALELAQISVADELPPDFGV